MKPKILEIAKKAGFQEGFSWVMEDFSIDKFAKLIIEDALDVMKDEVSYNSDWKVAEDVASKVKIHFGIE
jgi:hypothetical protein